MKMNAEYFSFCKLLVDYMLLRLTYQTSFGGSVCSGTETTVNSHKA